MVAKRHKSKQDGPYQGEGNTRFTLFENDYSLLIVTAAFDTKQYDQLQFLRQILVAIENLLQNSTTMMQGYVT